MEELIGGLLVGPGGRELIEAAKKIRSFMAKIRIAEMIDEAMESQNMSQEELLRYLNISHPELTSDDVKDMINGTMNFSLDLLIRLEEVLLCDLISNALYKDESMRIEYGVHYLAEQNYKYK